MKAAIFIMVIIFSSCLGQRKYYSHKKELVLKLTDHGFYINDNKILKNRLVSIDSLKYYTGCKFKSDLSCFTSCVPTYYMKRWNIYWFGIDNKSDVHRRVRSLSFTYHNSEVWGKNTNSDVQILLNNEYIDKSTTLSDFKNKPNLKSLLKDTILDNTRQIELEGEFGELTIDFMPSKEKTINLISYRW